MTNDSLEDSSTPISESAARFALWAERYLLPWIFFYLAWTDIKGVFSSYERVQKMIHMGYSGVSIPLFFAQITRNVLLCWLLTFFGLTLFISRRPVHLPKKLVHITVPLAMSYYFFLYQGLNYLPREWGMNVNLLPVSLQIPASAVAVFLAIIGYAISLWGIAYLRRSFALMVAVREVVSGGPYAYVRHPMYLGYIFELAGLVLASFSTGMFIAAAGFLALMVVRARLEEARIIEACPAYRDYMQRTGFLFPRFHRPGPATAEAKV